MPSFTKVWRTGSGDCSTSDATAVILLEPERRAEVRSFSRAQPRGKPGFSTLESSSGRETDSPLDETRFEPLVPGATAAAEECGWRRRHAGSKKPTIPPPSPDPTGGLRSLFVRYIGLMSWASLAALPLGKSSIALRSDLTMCGGSPRSAQSSNLATSSSSSSGLSGLPRFTITSSKS